MTQSSLKRRGFSSFSHAPVRCLAIIFTFEVQAISFEKLPFIHHVIFTIAPRLDDELSLQCYTKLISPHDKLSHHVKEPVEGIIKGETRILMTSMTMEEIFKGNKEFKQEEKVIVGEVGMESEIRTKLRDHLIHQNATKIDAEMKIVSMQRQGEGKKKEIRVKTEVKVAEVKTVKAVVLREVELQRAVERMNTLTITDIAKINAEAVQHRLQPEISIWNTSNGSGDNHNGAAPGESEVSMKEVAGVYLMLPPLFKTIQECKQECSHCLGWKP
ncbi:Flotillin family [Parasponia andersonii]|uniref:Flotillin-like n=1 Tax=Parasponia andersonii TaxID=3476 RepID=A0A2P5BYP8_PARAD|nr:Flotillin family [Parasponia andersonii]